MTDHYETLGVQRSASEDEIRQAFRRRAKDAHPDREGGDTDTMANLNRAYATLTDQRSRARYDQTGADPKTESLEQRAMAELRKLLGLIADQVEDGDLCALMVHHLLQAKVNLTNARNAASNKLRKYARLRKRIARKGGNENLFDCVFAEKITNAERDLAQTSEGLEELEAAMKILADYETVFEQQQFIVFTGSPIIGAPTA